MGHRADAMKTATTESLFAEAAAENRIGRYELVCRLAESLGLEPEIECGESGLTPCQRAELERRLESNDPGIPAERVFAELNERLRQRREALDRLPPELRPRWSQDIERDALSLPDADRRQLTRRLVATLIDDYWYADDMRALAAQLDQANDQP